METKGLAVVMKYASPFCVRKFLIWLRRRLS